MRSFNAQYARKQTTEEGRVELVFTLANYADNLISAELEKDTLYRLQLVKVKSKRTLEQNALMWSTIHEIAVAENGEKATTDDEWNIYVQCLEKAGAKCEVVVVRQEALPMLAETFRAYRVLGTVESPKGWQMVQVRVFYGSSKMDAGEMAKLLDVVIDRAVANGIELRADV